MRSSTGPDPRQEDRTGAGHRAGRVLECAAGARARSHSTVSRAGVLGLCRLVRRIGCHRRRREPAPQRDYRHVWWCRAEWCGLHYLVHRHHGCPAGRRARKVIGIVCGRRARDAGTRRCGDVDGCDQGDRHAGRLSLAHGADRQEGGGTRVFPTDLRTYGRCWHPGGEPSADGYVDDILRVRDHIADSRPAVREADRRFHGTVPARLPVHLHGDLALPRKWARFTECDPISLACASSDGWMCVRQRAAELSSDVLAALAGELAYGGAQPLVSRQPRRLGRRSQSP